LNWACGQQALARFMGGQELTTASISGSFRVDLLLPGE